MTSVHILLGWIVLVLRDQTTSIKIKRKCESAGKKGTRTAVGNKKGLNYSESRDEMHKTG